MTKYRVPLLGGIAAGVIGAGKALPRLVVRKTSREKTPFFTNKQGKLIFDNQEGRGLTMGISFTPAEGYKVMVRFTDETESNDIAAAGARSIAKLMFDRHEPMHIFMRDRLNEHADKADELNKAWEGDGRPATGFQALLKGGDFMGVVEEEKP